MQVNSFWTCYLMLNNKFFEIKVINSVTESYNGDGQEHSME